MDFRTRARARARRSVAGLVATGLAVVALAGCGQIGSALGQQVAVVSFRPDTMTSEVTAVRRACPARPGLRPIPLAQLPSPVDARYSLRYQSTGATGAQLEALRACVARFPAVAGVSVLDVAKVG